MRYYPIAVDTKDKNMLVVGGGRAAYIKLKNLIKTCAIITVVSKEFCTDLLNLKKINNERLFLEKKTLIKDRVDNIDLSDKYNMVFICTDDRELNKNLYKYFKSKNILAMMCDDRENSDFINSAVLEKKNITIAFNTEGKSPTATKLLLTETEKILTDKFIEKIDLICKIREKLIKDKYKNLDEKDFKVTMESISLLSNEELERKLRMLNEITGESK